MADFSQSKGDSSFLRFKKTGRYFGPYLTGGALTTQALSSTNSLRAFPLFIPKTAKFDRIAIRVSTAATGATPRARLGVYEDNGSVYPGKLVLDAGEVDVSATGVKELTIDVALKGGKLYWLVFVGQDTASLAVGAIPTSEVIAAFLGLDSTLAGTPILGYAAVQTYGALPNAYPAGASDWSLPLPLIALRKA
jgi:hypothetical protein